MRQTEYRRKSRAISDGIVEQVQLAAQAELAWLFRQVQLKVRRINQFRPHTSTRRPKLQKAYTVSGDLWELFRQRMRASVMRALLFGAVNLAQLERAMFPDLQPIEFSSEEFAALIEPELAVNITHVTNNIKRIVGRRVVGWYNSPGSTMQSLVDNLRPEFSLSRAKRIAQTEVTNLNSRVKEETARTIGASEWWWSTRQDELVCRKPLVGPDGKRYNGCRELHGKRFPIGLKMPPVHVNCRCSSVVVAPRAVATETPKQVIEGLLMRKADFVESEHPRANNGEFTDKGAGSGGAKTQEDVKQESVKVETQEQKRSRVLNDLDPIMGRFKEHPNEAPDYMKSGSRLQGDPRLKYVAHEFGFDGLPKVVKQDEFDKMAENKEVIKLYRGVVGNKNIDAKQMVEKFKHGDCYYGIGSYGNGIYTAIEKKDADDYARGDDGAVITLGLLHNSKVITLDDLNQAISKDNINNEKSLNVLVNKMRDISMGNIEVDDDEMIEIDKSIRSIRRQISQPQDQGEWAIMNGYDAIYIRDVSDYYIILNRSKVVVAE